MKIHKKSEKPSTKIIYIFEGFCVFEVLRNIEQVNIGCYYSLARHEVN